jgi:membrane protease YdiL (CAAX protease family)
MPSLLLATPPPTSPELELPRYLLYALALFLFILIADVAIIAVWSSDARRPRPLLAPRWSLAHLFLGFQGWIFLTAALGVPMSILFWLTLTRLERLAVPLEAARAWAMMPMLVIQNVAMAGVVLFFVRSLYREPVAAAGLSGRDLRRGLALGAAVAFLAIPATDLTERVSALAIAHVMPTSWEAGWRRFQELTNIQELLLNPLHTPLGLLALVLVVGLAAPLGEEIFFRGFAHRALRQRLGLAAGSIASAGLFAVIHVSPVGLVPIFLIGLLLAYLYERTGSLAAPVALHAVNNSFAVIVAYFNPEFTFWPFLPHPG